jgi:hypothetical protein
VDFVAALGAVGGLSFLAHDVTVDAAVIYVDEKSVYCTVGVAFVAVDFV